VKHWFLARFLFQFSGPAVEHIAIHIAQANTFHTLMFQQRGQVSPSHISATDQPYPYRFIGRKTRLTALLKKVMSYSGMWQGSQPKTSCQLGGTF
jgi:hypothetical protein